MHNIAVQTSRDDFVTGTSVIRPELTARGKFFSFITDWFSPATVDGIFSKQLYN